LKIRAEDIKVWLLRGRLINSLYCSKSRNHTQPIWSVHQTYKSIWKRISNWASIAYSYKNVSSSENFL